MPATVTVPKRGELAVFREKFGDFPRLGETRMASGRRNTATLDTGIKGRGTVMKTVSLDRIFHVHRRSRRR